MSATFRAVACAAALAVSVSAAPSRAAVDLLSRIEFPSAIGVDRSGSLWVWNARDQSVSRITPAGKQVTANLGSEAVAIDADTSRGIVALTPTRDRIRVIDWSGEVVTDFPLPHAASSLVWMEGDDIAIAPQTAPWRAEIWSTARKQRVSQLGAVPEIKRPRAGAVPVRPTVLRYDAAGKQLLTFDAFEGDLVVFAADGAVVRTAKVLHPQLDANRQFLRTLDARAIQAGQSSMPNFMNYARFSLAGDGTVWLGEESGDDASMKIVKIHRDGTVHRTVFRVPECNSVRFELWQGLLVFFRDPKSPLKQCVVAKEIPR